MAGEGRVLTVGLAGLGAIGLGVAKGLKAGIRGLAASAVAARDTAKAERSLAAIGLTLPIIALEALPRRCDIVVEALPAASFAAIAGATIEAGKILMPLSVGALLDHMHLVERARSTGARIIVPTGALIGLDAVRAAAEGTIRSVKLISRKPPRGLMGAPHLVQNNIVVEGISAPLRVFAGSAREAARGFPANVNVGAALSLAGIGPDRTEVEVWADPGIDRNIHSIEVEADSARFSMTIENVPSEENPRTGKITALSTLAALRGLVSEIRVGT